MRVNTRNHLIVILIIAFVFGGYIAITELKEKKKTEPETTVPDNINIDDENTVEEKPSIIDEIRDAKYAANKSSAMLLLKKIEQQISLGNYLPEEALVINAGKIDNSSIKINIEFDADLTVTQIGSLIDGTITIKGDTFTVANSEFVK